MKLVIAEPNKFLKRKFCEFNKKFFNRELPAYQISLYWSGWIFEKEDSLGVFLSESPAKMGPFKNEKEAESIAKFLNRLRPKQYDYAEHDIHGNKIFYKTPYILIAWELADIGPKTCSRTLLHEMVHFKLFLQGRQDKKHGEEFDEERRRLLQFREVREFAI